MAKVEGGPGGEELGPRKRLPSLEDAPWDRRPPPEGAGSVSVSELEPGDPGHPDLCKRCHAKVAELKRQALALSDPGSLKDPGFAAFLVDQLHVPDIPVKSSGHEGTRCQVCATPTQQLRHQALQGLCSEVPGFTPPSAFTRQSVLTFTPRQVGSRIPVGEKRRGLGWTQGPSPCIASKPAVQMTVGGGALTGALGSVTIQAQQYLEGMWSISRVNNFLPQPSPVGPCAVTQPSLQCHIFRIYKNCHIKQETTALQKNQVQLGSSINPSNNQGTSAAASFFIRAAQKLNLSAKRKKHQPPSLLHPQEPSIYPTNFSGILQVSPPPAPPCLLRAGAKAKENTRMGKVKVMMRICPSLGAHDSSESMSFLKVDQRKKQLTLYDPSLGTTPNSGHRRMAVAAPKMFAFDAVFTQDASQAEVCSGTVAEVIQSVVNGADGCIFCFGHVKLGKTYTMIGKDTSAQSLGIAPCAISWLFKLINERKEKTGTRFSVRVSAVEICGKDETLQDLLADVSTGNLQDGQSPGVYLREDPICGTQLQNQSELRAATAEKAALLLDAAIAARSTSRPDADEEDHRNSHMLFTLHIYQYRMEKTGKGGMSGGRSRLHLIDLGSCEKVLSKSRDGGGGLCLSLTALGNVILALANGAKHVPYRDSKLTMLLRESLGNINCRTTMIAHISDSPANYVESLPTIQLASRIHRMRKKKSKYASSSSGGESSCEEGRIRRPPHLRPFHPRTVALDPDLPSFLSDPDYSSSSEQSCDTVIYVGPGGAAISDQELSDNEGPPAFVPIIPSLNRKQRGKEGPVDRDHFKCNTFAELQERLECIDGSEEPTAFVGEVRNNHASPKMDSTLTKSKDGTTSHSVTMKTLSPPLKPGGSLTQQNCEQVVREKVFSKKSLPKPAPPPPQQGSTRKPSGESEDCSSTRMPPVGMSHQGGNSPVLGRVHVNSRTPVEVCHMRSTLRERCMDRDILRTTVTLQRPVELNGEDELVFTLVEELSIGGIVDNGRPSSIVSFNSDCSLQALASGSRPVSIISSINDEFDAYTSNMGSTEVNIEVAATLPEGAFASLQNRRPSISSWLSEVSVCTLGSDGAHSSDVFIPQEVRIGSEGTFYLDLSLSKCPSSPDSTKASIRISSKATKSNTLTTQQPQSSQCQHDVHSSIPRKLKPTSSVTQSSSTSGSSSNWNREMLHEDGKSGNPWQRMGSIKSQGPTSTQRVVDGCEKSTTANSKKVEPPSKMPQLRRGATTLGTIPVIHSSADIKMSQEATVSTSSLKFSSLGKIDRTNGQKATVPPKPGGASPPPPPVRKSSLDQKNRTLLPPSALKSMFDGAKTSTARVTGSLKTSSLKMDCSSAKATSSLKTRRARGDAGQNYGSQSSLDRCESLSSVGSKPVLSRENSGVNLGGNGKSSRSFTRFGAPVSATSPPSCINPEPHSKNVLVKGSINPRVTAANVSKARTLAASNSKALSTSTKSLVAPVTRNANLPPSGKTSVPRVTGVNNKPGRGTIMGTKQAMRAANSRVSELASGSGIGKHLRGSADSDSGNDSGVNVGDDKPMPMPILPSPYSKITAPRRPQRYSSGHGSDNSSVLSGELPPAMGRTALFYHSGGSSGYESMIRDSEATGSASSAHESMSESGMSSSGRTRSSKSPKKRSNGLQRRRLIPTPLPDTSSLGKKTSATGQWVDLPPMSGTLKEPFEIKVYEIDDVERLQRRRQEEMTEVSPFQEMEKGLLYFNSKLKAAEKREQQIRDLRAKHEDLKEELEETKKKLMMDPRKWIGEFEVDQDLDKETPEYLEALEQMTSELEYCVNLCKARVMMVTCFDIRVASEGQEAGPREVEV
uniref:Kinesin motor domain-containing protein n=1 Tax=Denticeps clupeoides TaxID=299321 RepID=A0AAY4AUE8_9TELE